MGICIGMDEAGYGPNLGPLVVTATAWEVPGHPRDFDFWTAFDDVVTQSPRGDKNRLHIADSKQVYTPARGIGRLEQAVLSALQLNQQYPCSFRELMQILLGDTQANLDDEPWFLGCDLKLPHNKFMRNDLAQTTSALSERWRDCCEKQGIRLKAIQSDVVLTERFNDLTRSSNSKGLTLSRVSMRLLRRVWDPNDGQPTFIIADKHGGRNRYDELLDEVLDGQMIFRGTESTPKSSYRVGSAEIHFQSKAESHFPVALASMVCKYVRELAMVLFNNFWSEHIPGLKPTKGYPTDARRFKKQISEKQAKLGISETTLWRER